MADENDNEKTEEASDTRREEFRKQGQVPHTRELSTAFMLIGVAGLVSLFGGFFQQQFRELFQFTFGDQLVAYIREGNFTEASSLVGIKIFILVFPIVIAGAILGSLSSILQIGFMTVDEALSPNANRLNPIEGFKRIFSLRGLVEGLKSLVKVLLIGVVVYITLEKESAVWPYLQTYSKEQLVVYVGAMISKLFFGIGMVMLVLAAGDYFFQWWDLEKKMMMTKQEIKEEIKQREGDPMIKARVRKIQREVATRRMMDKVPKGDVVITNPTHIAVVLKYDDNLPAPQLIAKGADLVAEKIKEIARENKIPIIENKPLARTIFKTMKLGQIIPRELYVAVAEVLSYVFKLKRKAKST
ncbi:MAG: flagellar biosynthesis protein FlhB [Bdellovibrionaceae bacterium]|nr:flagellar biosynthesis protein FlhB [Pseudobdellovibrionaceae bacterium]